MDNNEVFAERAFKSLTICFQAFRFVSLCFSEQVTGSINSRGGKLYILVSNAAVSNDKTNAKHI